MGQEIVYCSKCQMRILGNELEKGLAYRIGDGISCAKCAVQTMDELPGAAKERLLAKLFAPPRKEPQPEAARTSPVRLQARGEGRTGSGSRSASGISPVVWLIAGGTFLALSLLIGFSLGKSGRELPAPQVLEKARGDSPAPEEDRRDRSAREALARAKRLPASDLDAQIQAYAQAVHTAEGTKYLREARECYQELLDLEQKGFSREVVAAEEQARPFLAREQYRAALDLYVALRPKHPGAEWTRRIDGKIEDIRRGIESVLGPLKEKAADALRAGRSEELQLIRNRISQWNLPEFVADVDQFLKGVPPAADFRPWRSLLENRTLDVLQKEGAGSWRIENGVLMHVPGAAQSAQTSEKFADGELRLRFEVKDADHLYFKIRQGTGGGYAVSIEGPAVKALEGNAHELLFVAKGDQVSASLDGTLIRIQVEGAAQEGFFQFNAGGKTFNVLSIDIR